MAAFALLLGVGMLAVGPVLGGEDKHPAPWRLSVDGERSGFVAVAALDGRLSGPVAQWVSRAATENKWAIAPAVTDQEKSLEDAWRAASSLAHDGYPYWMVQAAPEVEAPEAWLGLSTGLAYTLAFLDSSPLNPTPGSLSGGRTIVATGRVTASGDLRFVGYLPAKTRAAMEAGADIFFVPHSAYVQATQDGFIRPDPHPQDVVMVPVSSVKAAVRYLCATGGSGQLCDDMMLVAPKHSDDERGLFADLIRKAKQGRVLPRPNGSLDGRISP